MFDTETGSASDMHEPSRLFQRLKPVQYGGGAKKKASETTTVFCHFKVVFCHFCLVFHADVLLKLSEVDIIEFIYYQ